MENILIGTLLRESLRGEKRKGKYSRGWKRNKERHNDGNVLGGREEEA